MSTYNISEKISDLVRNHGIDQCKIMFYSTDTSGMRMCIKGYVEDKHISRSIDLDTDNSFDDQVEALCESILDEAKEIRNINSGYYHCPPQQTKENKPTSKWYTLATNSTPTIYYKDKTITLPDVGSPWRYSKGGGGCVIHIWYSIQCVNTPTTVYCETLDCVLATAVYSNQKYYLNYSEEDDCFEMYIYDLDTISIHQQSTQYKDVDIININAEQIEYDNILKE
jgi:hypothetical protein